MCHRRSESSALALRSLHAGAGCTPTLGAQRQMSVDWCTASARALRASHTAPCAGHGRMHRPCPRPSLASCRGRVRRRRVHQRSKIEDLRTIVTFSQIRVSYVCRKSRTLRSMRVRGGAERSTAHRNRKSILSDYSTFSNVRLPTVSSSLSLSRTAVFWIMCQTWARPQLL